MARTELWIDADPPPGRVRVAWSDLERGSALGTGDVAVCARSKQIDPRTGAHAVARAVRPLGRALDSIVVSEDTLDLSDGQPMSWGVGASWRVEWVEQADRVLGVPTDGMLRLNPALRGFSLSDPGQYDAHVNDRQATWVAALSGRMHAAHTLVLRSRWGLRPDVLLSWWMTLPSGVERAAGFAWTPDRPDVVARLDAAGPHPTVTGHGTWWVGTDRRHWPTQAAHLDRIEATWHPDVGDRESRIVFIGADLPKDQLEQGFIEAVMPEDQRASWRDAAMTPFPFARRQ